jgi:hypothetical protein
MSYKVVEKANHLAVHALCSTLGSAQAWIERNGDCGMFMDKTLTRGSFAILFACCEHCGQRGQRHEHEQPCYACAAGSRTVGGKS